MADEARMYGRDEPNGRDVHVGVTLRAVDSKRMSVNRYAFAPGARFPLHRHAEEQVVYVLDGSVEFTVADVAHELSRDELLVVPGGLPHEVTAGPEGARVLSVLAPPRVAAVSYVEPEPSR
jgi:quercetin dioxygenase-like cupin family protein